MKVEILKSGGFTHRLMAEEAKRVDFLVAASRLFPANHVLTSHLRLSASELAARSGQRVRELSCFRVCSWCAADRTESKAVILPARKTQWRKKNEAERDEKYVLGGRPKEGRNVVKWTCKRCGESSQVSLRKPRREKMQSATTSQFFIDRVPTQKGTPGSSGKRRVDEEGTGGCAKKRKIGSASSTPPLATMKRSKFRNKKLANFLRQHALDREKESSFSSFLQNIL